MEDAQDRDFPEQLRRRVQAAPDGMSVPEILTAFPEVNKPRLYRAITELMNEKRLTRTGKPRTPDVRYKAL